MGLIPLAFGGLAGGPDLETPEGLGSAEKQGRPLAIIRSLVWVPDPG